MSDVTGYVAVDPRVWVATKAEIERLRDQLTAAKQLLREILDELSGDKHYWHSCSQWRERAKEVDSDRT
jgi:hypothetical protein